MTTRAFIIAVEHYPRSKTTSRTLPGTIKAANRFVDWAQENLNIETDDIIFCSSNAGGYKTHGTTASEIKEAILDLIRKGYNDTDRLLVYTCGHGVMIPGREYDLDILLCSDFIEPQISGSACVEVNELTELLANSLGIGVHVYFLDACRTTVERLDATRLGLSFDQATSGKASWVQIASAQAGQSATNDSLFIDSLLAALDGECRLVKDRYEEGQFWVTIRNVAEAIDGKFKNRGRQMFMRSEGGVTDFPILSFNRASVANPIIPSMRPKAPPVELLAEFEEIVFLGETNGQLPQFVQEAFEERDQRPWKRLSVLYIDDLKRAFRADCSLQELESERTACEEFFRSDGPGISDSVTLYRYSYAGTYGSFWLHNSGKRRVHVSAGLLGEDIRKSPASDYVDFPDSRHPKVDQYFKMIDRVIESEDCSCIFRHPGNGR